jgi:epoxyqueuosine reductase
MALSAQQARAYAAELGFNLIGLAPARPSPHLDAYFHWIEAAMHGDMGYMARADRQARRRDLNVILPGVQSMLVVGLDYHALPLPGATAEALADPARGRIAAYAWGLDYHQVMLPRLDRLATWLRATGGQQVTCRVYVDTGAVLERSHAQQAGLGFIGKNTMLINLRRGSAFFLGEVLTGAGFDDYDRPHRETMCGSCNRCRAACPTDAFPQPYVLDARRCISYLTIENKGWIDRQFRPAMGNWVFGCDICQDVCPFTRFVRPATEPSFLPVSVDRVAPPLPELLSLDDNRFRARFGGSAIARIGRERLVRNACVAAGNWGSQQAVPALADLLRDPSPLVRGHAAWALSRIGGKRAHRALNGALRGEPDPQARAEMRLALDGFPA